MGARARVAPAVAGVDGDDQILRLSRRLFGRLLVIRALRRRPGRTALDHVDH